MRHRTAAHCDTKFSITQICAIWSHVVAVCCSVLQCLACAYFKRQRAMWRRFAAPDCDPLQHTATHSKTQPRIATHCNVLQHHSHYVLNANAAQVRRRFPLWFRSRGGHFDVDDAAARASRIGRARNIPLLHVGYRSGSQRFRWGCSCQFLHAQGHLNLAYATHDVKDFSGNDCGWVCWGCSRQVLHPQGLLNFAFWNIQNASGLGCVAVIRIPTFQMIRLLHVPRCHVW